MEDCQIAAEVRAQLAARVGVQRYELWFGPHTNLCIRDDRLIVRAPSHFVRDWQRRHFADDVRACCQAVVGRELPLEFAVNEGDGSELCHAPSKVETVCASDVSLPVSATGPEYRGAAPPPGSGHQCDRRPAENDHPMIAWPGSPAVTCELGAATNSELLGTLPASGVTEANPAEALRRSHANPHRTRRDDPPPLPEGANTAKPPREAGLAEFVVGPSNEYAFRCAQLVTAPNSQRPSPVLFCGPTGVGKTRLLRAVRVEYLRRHRRARAVYLTAEQFTTAFVEALRGTGLPSFRQKCRAADLLLIDDLQFFAGKRATLEELLHTIDTLLGEGRQIVLASDRGLADMRSIGPELVSRLAGGLMCEIQPPEFATRLGIVGSLREEMRLDIDEEVLRLIATHVTAGARELRGALHRLQLTSLALGQSMSRDLAERALAELAQQCTRPVRLADVAQAVCQVFGVEPSQLRSERKGRSVSEPRMLAMWLARKYTRAPWNEIGEFFGRRSHSTVISAHHRVEKLLSIQAKVGVHDQTCGMEEAIRRVEAVLRTA